MISHRKQLKKYTLSSILAPHEIMQQKIDFKKDTIIFPRWNACVPKTRLYPFMKLRVFRYSGVMTRHRLKFWNQSQACDQGNESSFSFPHYKTNSNRLRSDLNVLMRILLYVPRKKPGEIGDRGDLGDLGGSGGALLHGGMSCMEWRLLLRLCCFGGKAGALSISLRGTSYLSSSLCYERNNAHSWSVPVKETQFVCTCSWKLKKSWGMFPLDRITFHKN